MAQVFVGIPTRNRPAYVGQAVRSVLAQSAGDLRVVVSDNASEPAASAAVEEDIRALGDPRVHYYRQPTDIKEYGQGRYLFSQCREEYFTILHDDDLWEPNFLEATLAVMQRDPELALVTTAQTVIDAEGREQPQRSVEYARYQGRDRYPEGRLASMLEPLLACGFFPITGSLFRSAALRRSGLVDPDCEGNYPFEFNLFLRLAEIGAIAYYVPRPLVRYRFHDRALRAHLTPFHKPMLRTYITLLERRRFSGPVERLRRHSLASTYRNYAIACVVTREWRAVVQSFRRALWLSPLNWKIWAAGVFCATCPFLIRRLFGARVTQAAEA